MAERLIIELKDKISKLHHIDLSHSSGLSKVSGLGDLKQDLSSALRSLGYKEDEIKRSFIRAAEKLSADMSVEEGIKVILKNF